MVFYAFLRYNMNKKKEVKTLKVYTVRETAEILKVHPRTVTRKINKGELKAKNIGSELRPDYRIKYQWIEDYLNKK